MDIKVFVGQNGLVVFACQGVFRTPLESVVYQETTSLILLDFGSEKDREFLNCPLDTEIAEKLKKQGFGAFGYFENTELHATQVVPLVVEQ